MEPSSTLHTSFLSAPLPVLTAVLLSLVLVIGSAWWVFRRKLQPKIR